MSRNYKKNLKKFYVVHPSWWFKAVLFVMQKIVSSKFAQKIVNLEKLSELAIHVPMDSLEIPEAVRAHDLKRGNPVLEGPILATPTYNRAREQRGGVKHSQRRRGDVIFGAQLNEAVEEEAEEAPIAILSLIDYLRANALNEEQIFRTSPNQTDVIELKERLDRGINNKSNILGLSVEWADYELSTLAGLLKAYVRELPEPLIPQRTYPNLLDVEDIEGQSALVHYIRQSFVEAMGERERLVLADICYLLRDVAANESANQMGVKALAMVWTPNFIHPESSAQELQLNKAGRKLIECLIEYCELIFPQH